MKRVSKKTKIFNILRLTTSLGEEINIKPNILPNRALKKLHEYENTGLTPSEILDMKETVLNLQKHIKKLEEWN